MDTKKIVLYFALAIVLFWLWNAWQQDYGTKQQPVNQKTQQPSRVAAVSNNSAEKAVSSNQSALPPSSALTSIKQQAVPEKAAKASRGRLIEVKTDVLNVDIDTQGGNIIGLSLPKYPISSKKPDTPVQLMNSKANHYYVAESGIASEEGPDTKKGQAVYRAPQSHYVLAPDKNTLTVPLTWQSNGLTVTKLFIFQRNRYQVKVKYLITNRSGKTWTGHFYAQLRRLKPDTSSSMFHFHTFQGAAVSSPQKAYEKLSYKKLAEQNINRNIQGGWLAIQQRYFLSAWVPNQQQTNHYYSKVSPNQIYTVGFVGPTLSVSPGASKTVSAKLYAGPEVKERLASVAKNLDRTIDFGFLWIIAIGILWLMEKINIVVGNWGWSIILVTVLIKLVFWKFSEKSYRSMAKMRQLAPRLKLIKERHGDDKQKLSQATMELYKKEKVNPAGGCLPMLIQIPFFFALYYVLLEAVQLRQAPFMLWIHDLSSRDPYFILPLLMGASMWWQQKLNPEPPDPTQAKMMMFLPIIFTVFFLYFPAGLVLYWLTNNLVSILQQWLVMKRLEKEEKKQKQKR